MRPGRICKTMPLVVDLLVNLPVDFLDLEVEIVVDLLMYLKVNLMVDLVC